MSVDLARKDAAAGAEWLRKMGEIQSRLDKRDEFEAMADAVDVLVSELEAAQKERGGLEAAHKAARMALRNAQTEATHGKTASVAFIDQCIDSAVRALDAAAAVSGVAAPTERTP